MKTNIALKHMEWKELIRSKIRPRHQRSRGIQGIRILRKKNQIKLLGNKVCNKFRLRWSGHVLMRCLVYQAQRADDGALWKEEEGKIVDEWRSA